MRFLRYIRRWGKKVVFLLNKVDILSGPTEVRAQSPPSWQPVRLLAICSPFSPLPSAHPAVMAVLQGACRRECGSPGQCHALLELAAHLLSPAWRHC